MASVWILQVMDKLLENVLNGMNVRARRIQARISCGTSRIHQPIHNGSSRTWTESVCLH